MLEEISNRMLNILTNKLTPMIVIPTVIHETQRMVHQMPTQMVNHTDEKLLLKSEKQLAILMAYEMISPRMNQDRFESVTQGFYQSSAQLVILLMIQFLMNFESDTN
jgi:acetyl-CoA carboxylase alpha subunit